MQFLRENYGGADVFTHALEELLHYQPRQTDDPRDIVVAWHEKGADRGRL